MVFVVACTGLGVSELLALKWSDLNFASEEINLRRGIVRQNIGEMKTGGITEAHSIGHGTRRSSDGVSRLLCLQPAQRLDFRIPRYAGQPTVLAE